MSEQEGQDSSSNSSGYPSSSSWPNQSSLQSPRHTVSINSAATSFSNPSSRLTAAESHGGSNFGSSSSSSSVGGGEMQHEGLTASLSCSSSGFATASNSLASAQARVSMACTHCRQRKIRCDGQQPTCSTCFRLGRYCVYESISEVENQLAREKKKRSKEVKQARLKSLAGIGIAIPFNSPDFRLSSLASPKTPSSTSTTTVVSSGGRQPVQYTSGAIRDSRLARQERSRPYKNLHSSQPPSPMYPPDQQQQYQRQQQQAMQGQQRQQQPGTMQRISSGSIVQTQSGRKRGITLDSLPTHFQPSHNVEEYGSDTSIPMTFTSLSQPTTPEATYSTHASILSQELSHPSSREPITRPTTIPAIYDIQATPILSNQDDKDVHRSGNYLTAGFNYTPSPTYPSAEQFTSAARSSAGNDTMATSLSSMSQAASTTTDTVSPLAMQRFMAENADLEAQLALRRRSSFDVGDFWRRTSVADAAVANFFDRVIAAKGSRKDSTEGISSPSFRSYPIGQSLSQQVFAPATTSNTMIGSSGLVAAAAAASSSSSSSRIGADTPYRLYSNLQGIMQNATPLDTPYTALNSNPERLVFSHPFTLASQEQQQPSSQNQPFDSTSYDIPATHHHHHYHAQESRGITPSAYIPSATTTTSSHGGFSGNNNEASIYHLHSYFHEEPGQLQRPMGNFASSRQGSLSSSIPEEAGEEEYLLNQGSSSSSRYGGIDRRS